MLKTNKRKLTKICVFIYNPVKTMGAAAPLLPAPLQMTR